MILIFFTQGGISTVPASRKEMQQVLDWWDRGITATGGSLVPKQATGAYLTIPGIRLWQNGP
jgi:hypothetical protein